jgi:hypothetical protein
LAANACDIVGEYTPFPGDQMATTDYDAPRRSPVDEADSDVDALAASRAGQQSPLADVDEGDTADAVDLPGAELIGEELTMPVVPKRADEFTCASCFLVQHRSRIAPGPSATLICVDCA